MRPPRAPERPLVPYMRFSRKMWTKIRQENKEQQIWDIGKIIAQMWRDAPEAEKGIYQHEYEIEKVGDVCFIAYSRKLIFLILFFGIRNLNYKS